MRAGKAPLEIPIGMRRVCRRFERWREGHKGRLPIPASLWASAAEMAREHGVFQTAKVLLRIPGEGECDSGMNVKNVPGRR